MIQIFSILIDRHYRNYYFLNSSNVNPIQSILTILFSSQSNPSNFELPLFLDSNFLFSQPSFSLSSGMGAGGMPGGGMGGMKTKMRGMMGGGGHMMKNMMGGGGGGMGLGGGMAHHLPHLSLRQLLKDMEVVSKRKGHDMKTMKMLEALKHQILDKVSCETGCMHHQNEHGLCYEQSCAFHYQPGLTELKVPTICADEISLMAMTKEAEGLVHFGVRSFPIEPDDDMLPTQLYNNMDTKYKYHKRLKDGTLIESSTMVCHNASCAEHPPPIEINAGDTLYITVVAIGPNGEFRHLHPDSFRVLVFGSQTGASCGSYGDDENGSGGGGSGGSGGSSSKASSSNVAVAGHNEPEKGLGSLRRRGK